jgi:prepilin-type N-terminal cleavage/methylation domain-containing protein
MSLFQTKLKKKKHAKNDGKRGFTIIELIVVSALFGVMAVVAVMGQSRLDNNLLIDNMAYEIALAIREAQVYGLATRQSASDFNVLYGIHFDENSNTFFTYSKPHANPDASGKYDANISVKVDTYQLAPRMSISQICALSVNSMFCQGDVTRRVDIAFIRPNPDARFYFYDTNGDPLNPGGQTISSARITVRSDRGIERRITIGLTGQITVE